MKRNLDEIQILRALAALAVLVFHVEREIASLDPSAMWSVVQPIAWVGQFGVDIFFVISGFIMYYIHADDFGKRGQMGNFFKRRLIRIVPSYWLLTSISVLALITIPTAFNSREVDWPWIGASFLFIPWTGPNEVIAPVVGPGWTLNFEMFFYLVFGALLALPKRKALATLIFLFSGLTAVGSALHPAAPVIALITSSLLIEFLVGVAIGWAAVRRLSLPWLLRGLLLSASFLILVIGPALYPVDGLSTIWRLVFFGLPAAGIVAAVVLRDYAYSNPYRCGPTWRLLVIIGDSSYALYLTHIFTIRICGRALESMVPQIPAMLTFSILFASAVLAGHLFYKWFDRPVYEWLKQSLKSSRV